MKQERTGIYARHEGGKAREDRGDINNGNGGRKSETNEQPTSV